jgi:hypothetical protein
VAGGAFAAAWTPAESAIWRDLQHRPILIPFQWGCYGKFLEHPWNKMKYFNSESVLWLVACQREQKRYIALRCAPVGGV